MKPELYQEVALTREFPQHNLHKGDIVTLIDYIPHPQHGEEGGILEIFNAAGETIAVVTIPISSIETLRPDDILSIRRLAQAS
jgi:hypothetical protein